MMITIKLPNFFKSSSFIALKSRMGIDKNTYGNFGDSKSKGIQNQLETIGIEVENISDIVPLDDYTLTYNGERIIVYIRDVNQYNNEVKLPKFHVANCKTLQQMIKDGRKRRYVVSKNTENSFHLNFISGNSVRKEDHALSVCKNCLEILRWDGYSQGWNSEKKDECVSYFQIRNFFSKYPMSLIDKKGFSDKSSSFNQYSNDWNNISHIYKKSQKWVCEQCGVNLIHSKPLIHTHHINGQKNENDDSNLMALCVCCHVSQPMHDHMLNIPDIDSSIKEVLKIRKRQNIICN